MGPKRRSLRGPGLAALPTSGPGILVRSIAGRVSITAQPDRRQSKGAQGRTFSRTITVAAGAPTPTEIATAVLSAYSAASTAPQSGDLIALTTGAELPKLRAEIRATGPAASIWCVQFTYTPPGGGAAQTWFAHVVQVGTW